MSDSRSVTARPPLTFLLVSQCLTPSAPGQAVMLGRLLRDVAPDAYAVASVEDHRAATPGPGRPPKLAGRYHELPPTGTDDPGDRRGVLGPARRYTRAARIVAGRAAALRRIVREGRWQAVVACSGDLYDLPAAWLAARLARVPFFAYYFDHYAEQFDADPNFGARQRAMTRAAEAMILPRCAGVIVPNEHLARELLTRHGVSSTIVRNPLAADVDPAPARPWPARADRLVIVYTGSIYAAQEDALGRLVAAIAALDRPGVELHLYTTATRDALGRRGLIAPFVTVHEAHAPDQIARIHREADVMFLPLAFGSPYPGVIRTSAPGKLGEYLASGRPTLAHAPADAWVSWYVSRHECGAVVDVPDAAALGAALTRLGDDVAWRERLVANAAARARADFTVAASRAALFDALARGAPPQ